MTKYEWRALRNHLMCLACCMDIATIEYKNVCRRIDWIYQNRL